MMQIDINLVEQELVAVEREVTARDTMNYAAAVADMNPRYFDDTHARGIIAPPLFAVTITWPVIQDLQRSMQNTLPAEVIATMVHANERLIFHRPIQPAMRLRVTGRVAAVSPTSAGTLLVVKLEAMDQPGQPVFTEYSGALFRGVGCGDLGRGKESLPSDPLLDSPTPGWEAELPVERRAPYLYDGCANIVFPIHTSQAFAHLVGLGDIILQGTATLATAAREIVDREAGGDPVRLKEIACSFRSPVYPGTRIRIQCAKGGEANGDARLGFKVFNASGRPALTLGYARLSP